ncbi:MAG: peptidoglycan DD-metalloendopeptidase family protein [Gemmobacter sp.]
MSDVSAAFAAGQRDLYAALGRAVAATRPGSGAETAARARAIIAAAPGEAGDRLRSVDAGLLAAVARHACGFEAIDGASRLATLLPRLTVAPMFDPDLAAAPTTALRTRGERPGMPACSDRAFDGWFAATGATYGLGLYAEDRSVYETPQFADAASPERRTMHLGIDVCAPAGTPVRAPLPGVVEVVAYNADPLDYGHTLILRHEAGGLRFWTLYGHLGGTLPGLCRPGQAVAAGQVVAHLGDWPENGGWAAHLHFQVIADRLSQTTNFFGVGHRSLWPVWTAISPDPNLLLRLSPDRFAV